MCSPFNFLNNLPIPTPGPINRKLSTNRFPLVGLGHSPNRVVNTLQFRAALLTTREARSAGPAVKNKQSLAVVFKHHRGQHNRSLRPVALLNSPPRSVACSSVTFRRVLFRNVPYRFSLTRSDTFFFETLRPVLLRNVP